MTSPPLSLSRLVIEAHDKAVAFHGNLNSDLTGFLTRVNTVIEKHLGHNANDGEAVNLCKKLYLTDLYLTHSCSGGNERAWQRFYDLYIGYIRDVARFFCQIGAGAQELADSIAGHVFLPDAAGNSRISNYDGRTSLYTWLRVIIKNRASDERELKSNNHQRLEGLPERADYASFRNVEVAAQTSKYERVISSALELVVESLTKHERTLLALRYIDSRSAIEIAKSYGVHPSTVSRQLSSIQMKVRDQVISILASNFLLANLAIEECLTEIVENPAYSVSQFL